jgi:hypothetical protein
MVNQPHTYGTLEVHHVHSQCTTKYLGWQIVSIVWADFDITVAALIEAINCLTAYRVSYDKAWRAKEHALALLWEDWKEAYAKVPRLLHVIAHFNPGTKCDIDTCGQWVPNEIGRYYPVLKHVSWSFPRCVTGFTHTLSLRFTHALPYSTCLTLCTSHRTGVHSVTMHGEQR